IFDPHPIEAVEGNSNRAPKTKTQTKSTMKNLKKIAVLLLILTATTGLTVAAHHESKPDATLRLSGGSFALGIGVSWGSGTLTYRGKDYPVKVKGLSIEIGRAHV